MKIDPIYQDQYTKDDIYDNLGQTIGYITILPLLLIYLRQASQMLTEKEVKIILFRVKSGKTCQLWE